MAKLLYQGAAMLIQRLVVSVLSVGMMVLGAGVVAGQDYPNKPIRIVTSAPGGTPDFMARLIAQGLTDSLGQQLVVDNRGSGIIPGQIVAKASPDGYTLLVAGGAHWLSPFMQKVPYDPVRDFAPIPRRGQYSANSLQGRWSGSQRSD